MAKPKAKETPAGDASAAATDNTPVADLSPGTTSPDGANSGDAPQEKPAKARTKAPELVTVDVLMRRNHPCGDGVKKAGEKLATVILEPGVNLNFLACAIENSLAYVAE
jgi:hypothetical protein